jgi:hypothetical protein
MLNNVAEISLRVVIDDILNARADEFKGEMQNMERVSQAAVQELDNPFKP